MGLVVGAMLLGAGDDRGISFPVGSYEPPSPPEGNVINEPLDALSAPDWGENWVITLPSGTIAGFVDQADGFGRINTPNESYKAPYATYAPPPAHTPVPILNFDITFRFRMNPGATVAQYPQLSWRYDTLDVYAVPDNGYYCYFGRQEEALFWERRESSTTTDFATAAFTFEPDETYYARVSQNLDTFELRVWLATEEPPTLPTLTRTDATYPAQASPLAICHGAQSINVKFFVNDIQGTYE